jgi:hypothetical protein
MYERQTCWLGCADRYESIIENNWLPCKSFKAYFDEIFIRKGTFLVCLAGSIRKMWSWDPPVEEKS